MALPVTSQSGHICLASALFFVFCLVSRPVTPSAHYVECEKKSRKEHKGQAL